MAQIKEFTNENNTKKVLIFKDIDRTKLNGFNYYLTVLFFSNMFGGAWLVNDSYKQKLDITSFKVAKRIATDLLNTEI